MASFAAYEAVGRQRGGPAAARRKGRGRRAVGEARTWGVFRLGSLITPTVAAELGFVGCHHHVLDFGHHLVVFLQEPEGLFVPVSFEGPIASPVFLMKFQFISFPSIIELDFKSLRKVEVEMIIIPVTVRISNIDGIPFLLEKVHVACSFGPLAACQRELLAKSC